LVGSGVVALVAHTLWFNHTGRDKERALVKTRIAQNATSFAKMFGTEAEQLVAAKLYPRLERLTFTHALPLYMDDRLFSTHAFGSILSPGPTEHTLGFDREDLLDEVLATVKELGYKTPSDAELSAELHQGIETVGQLVQAVARLTVLKTNP